MYPLGEVRLKSKSGKCLLKEKPLPLERFIVQFLNHVLNRVPLCQEVINSKVQFNCEEKLKLNHSSQPATY